MAACLNALFSCLFRLLSMFSYPIYGPRSTKSYKVSHRQMVFNTNGYIKLAKNIHYFLDSNEFFFSSRFGLVHRKLPMCVCTVCIDVYVFSYLNKFLWVALNARACGTLLWLLFHFLFRFAFIGIWCHLFSYVSFWDERGKKLCISIWAHCYYTRLNFSNFFSLYRYLAIITMLLYFLSSWSSNI